jgi:hypothetical protein
LRNTAEKFLSPKKAETKHCIQNSVGKLFLVERKQTSNIIYTEEVVLRSSSSELARTSCMFPNQKKKILSGELRKIHFHGGVPRMNADSGLEVRLVAFPLIFTSN